MTTRKPFGLAVPASPASRAAPAAAVGEARPSRTSTQAQTTQASARESGYSSSSPKEPGSAAKAMAAPRASPLGFSAATPGERRRAGDADDDGPDHLVRAEREQRGPQREEGVLAQHAHLGVAALGQPLVPRVVPRAQRPQQPVAHRPGHAGGPGVGRDHAGEGAERDEADHGDEPEPPDGQRVADAVAERVAHRRHGSARRIESAIRVRVHGHPFGSGSARRVFRAGGCGR